ncbi:MAG: hypothetical protein KDB05_32060, partial [Planctomycetales bacterium]|nr:hypothetical protein [Planctomycetales bacterium]
KNVVAELTRLEERADKYRSKSGRIQISVDDYNRLAAMTGGHLADEPGELTIEEYVGLIDEAIEAVVSELNVQAAFERLTDIAEEI